MKPYWAAVMFVTGLMVGMFAAYELDSGLVELYAKDLDYAKGRIEHLEKVNSILYNTTDLQQDTLDRQYELLGLVGPLVSRAYPQWPYGRNGSPTNPLPFTASPKEPTLFVHNRVPCSITFAELERAGFVPKGDKKR